MIRSMKATARALAADEAGFILSAELVLILTVGVLAIVVGLNAVAKSVNFELNDFAQAIGVVDQSYYYKGASGHKACVAGFGFKDKHDECDCATILTPTGNVKHVAGGKPE